MDARIGVTVSMFFLIQPVCRFFMKIERVWRCGISKVEKGKMDQPVGEGTVASYTRAFGACVVSTLKRMVLIPPDANWPWVSRRLCLVRTSILSDPNEGTERSWRTRTSCASSPHTWG